MYTMERLNPTEQRIGLSSEEFKAVSETVRRLVAEFKPVISLVLDPELKKKTGWRASWREEAVDSKWQWIGLDVGGLAVGQERVLKGPKGEAVNVNSRYKPISADEEPDFFDVDLTNRDGEVFRMGFNNKDYSIPVLNMRVEDEKSIFFYRLAFGGRNITVVPKGIGGIALFFNGLGFDAAGSPLIDLLERESLEVGEHGGIPDRYRVTLERPIDAVGWYMDQKYEEGRIGDVAKWIEGLPVKINLLEQIALLEKETKQTLQAILAVAKNPDLGSVWTEEQERQAFKEFRDTSKLRRRA